MAVCQSCGGIIGRDCFNPEECAWITQQMNAQAAASQSDDAYKLGYNLGYQEGYHVAKNELPENSLILTAFQNEPVNFLLSNALRHLTQDQQRQFCNALQERLPVSASIEDEAARLYPDTKENETVSMGHNGIQDLRRSAHITAARQYMDTIEELKAENEKMKKALEEIKEIKSIDYACYLKTQGIINETLK